LSRIGTHSQLKKVHVPVLLAVIDIYFQLFIQSAFKYGYIVYHMLGIQTLNKLN